MVRRESRAGRKSKRLQAETCLLRRPGISVSMCRVKQAVSPSPLTVIPDDEAIKRSESHCSGLTVRSLSVRYLSSL